MRQWWLSLSPRQRRRETLIVRGPHLALTPQPTGDTMRNSLNRWRRMAVLAPAAAALVLPLTTNPGARPAAAAACNYAIASLSPDTIVAGSGQFALDVHLTSAAAAQSTPFVLFDGEFVPTDPSDDGMVLEATIPGELLEDARTLDVTVQCSIGLFTAAAPFEVTAGGPTVANLLPSEAVAGSSWFILTVEGSGFSENSAITWNGTPLDTTYEDPFTLLAIIGPDLIATRIPDATAEVSVIVLESGSEEPALAAAVPFVILRSSSDVDCNGEAESADALYLMRSLAGLSTAPSNCPTNADNSRDNLTSISDVTHVRQELAGILTGGPLASATQP